MSQPAISFQGVSKIYRVASNPYQAVKPLFGRRPGRDEDYDDDLDEELLVEEEEPDEEGPPRDAREIVALDDITLDLAPGTRLAVLGPAGAGKTTLLKLIGRIVPPTAGRIVVRGQVSPMLQVATGLMNANVSGHKNAIFLARLFGVSRKVVERHLDEIAVMAGLEGRMEHEARTYSAQQYRRLGIAVALNLESDIVLADDKLLKGDDDFVDRCVEHLRSTTDRSVTLLMAASKPSTAEPYCDEAIWLDGGKIVERGPLRTTAPPKPVSRPRRSADAPTAGLDALSAEQRELVERLVVDGRSYAELATATGVTAEAVRERAHETFSRMAPDEGRLDEALRGSLVDHLLGQPRTGADPVLSFARPEARVWVRMIHWYLDPLGPGLLAAAPVLVDAPADDDDGLSPEIEPAAAALVDFIASAFGERRAREALTEATDKAIWKESLRVRWVDVGKAAGLPHDEVKAIVDGLVRLREAGLADQPAHAFDGRVTLLETTLRGADGEEAAVLRTDEHGTVEATVEVELPGVELRLQVVLEAPDAPPVRLSQPEPFVASAPGRYRIRAHLSGALLEEATYTARVLARVEAGGQRSRLERPDAFSFDVYAREDDDGDDPWTTGAPAVASDVSWEVGS